MPANPKDEDDGRVFATLVLVATLAAWSPALARDNGQWADAPAGLSAWYKSLMQPDRPEASCCGDADVYHADEYTIDAPTGRVLATITDNHGNSIANGTKILIPSGIINLDQNRTGHTLLFLGGTAGRPVVFCFLPAGGA